MSVVDVSFCIGGEAGQGVLSSGMGFAQAMTRGGLHVFGTPNYYSRIRGGHNFFTIRVSDEPVYAIKEKIELLLAFDETTVLEHVDDLVTEGVIVADEGIEVPEGLVETRALHLVQAPLVEIAENHGGSVMTNTAVLALVAGLVGFDLKYILDVITDNFAAKGEDIVQANECVAEDAYALVEEDFADICTWQVEAREAPERLTIDGNHAFGMGCIMGGCKFAAGYPMTPASSVLEYMAQHADSWGLVVKHAEDELAAVNMCVGAANAGVRAMTCTSGGGFDLMTEGLSLAGMTETPVVVYLGQRPGPATGLATRTAQGDLNLALYASHGEYPRVVLAPHTPQEAFYCAQRALNIAEKYQCVVIVLSDNYNANSLWSVGAEAFDPQQVQIDRGKLLDAEALEEMDVYHRYAITPDGVSPRALPGSHPKAVYLATGNEHRENGHITEDPEISAAMLDKRMRKLDGARTEMRAPFTYGPSEAEITFVSWGSSYGPVYEAMERCNAGGTSANMVHFVDLWPFPVEETKEILGSAGTLIDVEGNGTAEFASLLYGQTGIEVDQEILKYDGRPFTPEYIMEHVEGV
ncbi:MAG: 2-oxoacid:acceptor oxidoreductase subunit alpha [Anaerolineales bacterium]